MIKRLMLFRGLNYFRVFCSVAKEGSSLTFRYKIRPRKNKCATLLQDIFECSYVQANDLLKKHPFLQELDAKCIRDATKMLKIGVEEIRDFPRVLLLLPITIEHYILVLKESGFPKVSAHSILKYLVKKKISLLKTHRLLLDNANVSRNFLAALEAPANISKTVESIVDINSDANTISHVRDTVLKCYLQWRLNASSAEIEHLFSTYPRVLHKSLQLIQRTLSILLNELHFPENHITRNGHVIQAHPDHLRKIITNVPYLAGKPIRDVLFANPSMVAARYENFIEILQLLQKAGIPEEYIMRRQNLFFLSGQCVRERLPAIDPKHISPELKAYMVDEKFLQVLINYEIFNQRVTFLSNQPQSSSLPQVPSSSLLLGPQKTFERFVKGLGGQSIGNDIVNYLVKSLRMLEDDNLNVTAIGIRALLRKNPNWRNVPLSEVRTCFEMLCKRKYTAKEILSAIPILLYSSKLVEDNLNHLYSRPEISECFQLDGVLDDNLQSKDHDKSGDEGNEHDLISEKKKRALIKKYSLPLCLYFIEKEYHFSGDGVWFRC